MRPSQARKRWQPMREILAEFSGLRGFAFRAIFCAWRLLVHTAQADAVVAENQKLRSILGRKANDIWTMRKDELVRTATAETGLTLEQATAMNIRATIYEGVGPGGPARDAFRLCAAGPLFGATCGRFVVSAF